MQQIQRGSPCEQVATEFSMPINILLTQIIIASHNYAVSFSRESPNKINAYV